MRLLNSTDLTFLEIFEEDIPKCPYAILSHRWGSLADEVSYEDFLTKKKENSPGYQKIKSFCEWAATNAYKWVWIDTCCIDKRSSAELSEAINSMFAWYRRSSVCVVYLKDVATVVEDITKDEWFSRGWTLQELIAPRNLQFVTCFWERIGFKTESNIAQAVRSCTGIPQRVLSDQVDVKNVSVARRMSWMARRRTTKIEDMAYCLLGIFDVNMPLLYGEGPKAFQRLQLLIMEQYEDESIFAWSEQSLGAADSAFHGLLAKAPSQFAHCANIVAMRTHNDENIPSLRANARNVELCAGLLRSAGTYGERYPVFLHQLRCAYTSNSGSYLDVYVSENVMGDQAIRPCFIALSRKSEGDTFSRVRARQLPWTLAAYQDYKSLARQPRRPFRARTSFSVEAIIDRIFSGNASDIQEHNGYDQNTSAPARPTTDRSVPILQTSAPARATHNGQVDRYHSAANLQRPAVGQNLPMPTQYLPTTPPDPSYGDWYGPPPLPPRPNERYSPNSGRNAVSSDQPPPGAHAQSAQAAYRNAVSSDTPPSGPPTRSARAAVQKYTTKPQEADPNTPQWTEIELNYVTHTPYGYYSYGKNKDSGQRYGWDLPRNPWNTACKSNCNKPGCNSQEGKETAKRLELWGEEWHRYAEARYI